MKVKDFGALTKAETGLIAHLRAGKPGVYSVSGSVPPENAPKDLHIRASLIRALVLKQVEDCPLPERGLRIEGAYIYGDGPKGGGTSGLDLEGAILDRDLALLRCRFPDPILLRSARLASLFLNGSELTKQLNADRLEAAGGVFLRNLKATGEIRLLGAKLGSDLSCTDAKLNAKGNALSADRLEAKGGVFLRNLEAAGEIRLLGARLGGNLSCKDAKLNATGRALGADRLEVTGSVFLNNLEAAGEIRLPGAKLGGNLACDGAKMNATGSALSAQGADIAGSWFWRDGAQSRGAIDLTAAQIGTICDDPTCWPAEVLLHRCRYGAFTGKGVSGRERIDWLSRMKPREHGHDFWPHPYEECARALREAGHGTDAREVLIEKERLQRKARRRALRKELQSARALRDRSARSEGFAPNADRVVSAWFRLNIARIWDWTLGKSVDYGRRPGKAALWLACLWLLGAFMFARAAGFGEIKPNLPQIQRAPEWIACSAEQGTTVANTTPAIAGKARPDETQLDCFLRQPEAAAYPRFNPLIYSADTLLPIVSLEMQSYWIPDDRKPIGNTARLYLWLHIFAGWGLTLLAVAGFSGLIKTDNTK
ncbi:hypothetical protein [Paracoccus sp. (in: a-proteobacteria)]|uniref:hypothetical protein n=1 Tax=Paracoccus sp. TaxID=267 RepID=UPI0035B0A21B